MKYFQMVGVGGGHDATLRSAVREGLWDGDFGVMLEMRQERIIRRSQPQCGRQPGRQV